MKKYKIEFYSELLGKRIVKVVENPRDYKNAIILEIVKEEKEVDLAQELFNFLVRTNKTVSIIYGGGSNENNK